MTPVKQPLKFVYAAIGKDTDPAAAYASFGSLFDEHELSGLTIAKAVDISKLPGAGEKPFADLIRTSPAPEYQFLRVSNLAAAIYHSSEIWLAGKDPEDFPYEKFIADQCGLPLRFLSVTGPKPPEEIPLPENLRCAVHYTGNMQKCLVTTLLLTPTGYAPLPSISEFKSKGGCFGTALEKHIEDIDDYIAALQKYREEVLDTSRAYNEAVYVGPDFK